MAVPPADWWELARCVEADPEVFFPPAGESGRAAKAVCAGCEVQPQCLAYALARPELVGMWGGTSERERRSLRRAGRTRRDEDEPRAVHLDRENPQ